MDAQRRGAEDVALQREAVAVATGHLEDRLDAALHEEVRGGEAREVDLGSRAIGDVDGGGEPLQGQGALEEFGRIGRYRRRDLGGDDELAGAQPGLQLTRCAPLDGHGKTILASGFVPSVDRFMPELPDLAAYLDSLDRRIVGRRLLALLIASPFLLRTAVPPISSLEGKKVMGLRRIGKRIVFAFEDRLFLVLHLMIAGRLQWPAKKGRSALAIFEFEGGTLSLTEAGTRRRASLHLVQGEAALAAMDPGGMEVLNSNLDDFGSRLRSENHTLKRALTDPRLFAGIGNAYSDEILHRARLSPVFLTENLKDEEIERLHAATIAVLEGWITRLKTDKFPEKVTAFREGMAVHGRYRQPCPVCGSPVQRIVYAENETNYCARCQTGGKILADRALSRLLKKSWPRNIDELE